MPAWPIQLGALTREVHRFGIQERPKEEPLRNGLSLNEFVGNLQALKTPTWCDQVGRRRYHDPHECGDHESGTLKDDAESYLDRQVMSLIYRVEGK